MPRRYIPLFQSRKLGRNTRNGWGWRWREEDRGRWAGGSCRSVGYTHTACENVWCNFWNSAVSLPRATRMPLHPSFLALSFSSQHRSFFRFILISVLRLPEFMASRHPRRDATRRETDTVLWKFQQPISDSVYKPTRSQIIRTAFNLNLVSVLLD